MLDDDIAYLRRRIDQEMNRARSTTEPAAARIHREMAMHYTTALRAVGIDAAEPDRSR